MKKILIIFLAAACTGLSAAAQAPIPLLEGHGDTTWRSSLEEVSAVVVGDRRTFIELNGLIARSGGDNTHAMTLFENVAQASRNAERDVLFKCPVGTVAPEVITAVTWVDCNNP